MTRPARLDPYRPMGRVITPLENLSDTARAEVMDRVRWALYDYGDLERLARLTGKTPSCLYALRRGATRWPRWDTLFALLPHLGLELVIQDARRH